MTLVTIQDLSKPTHEIGPLVQHAMMLGTWYSEFKSEDSAAYSYTIDVGGEKAREPGIHASEMSHCQRQLTYSIMGTQRRPLDINTVDANMKMRFSIGHAVHAMLQNDMHRMVAKSGGRITFEEELKIHPGLGGESAKWDLHSSCDGLFTFWKESDEGRTPYLRVGLEIKTASALEFEKITKPKDEHIEQTTLYQRALDVPLMWTLYYNKSNSNWTDSKPPFLFKFDNYLWSTKLVPRFAAATRAAALAQLPSRQEGNQCNWCNFAWTCKPGYGQKKSRQGGPSSTANKPGAIRVP